MKMTKMSSHFLYHYFCLNFQKKIESNSQTRDSEQRAGESLDLQPSLSQAEGCRRRLNIRPDAPLGDKIDHYLGQGRGVARVAKVEEKQRIHPIGR